MEWLLVNILAPAGGPAFFAVVIWAIEIASGKAAPKREIASAYIDGQTGYVAMGWCAATLFDMDRYEMCLKHPVDWHGLTVFVGSILAFSGLVSAAGARWPLVKREEGYAAEFEADGTPMPKSPVKYLTAWLSLGFGVISLICMVSVHLQISQPGVPICP